MFCNKLGQGPQVAMLEFEFRISSWREEAHVPVDVLELDSLGRWLPLSSWETLQAVTSEIWF